MTQQPDRIPVDKIEILPPERGGRSDDRVYHSWERGTVKIIRLGPLGGMVMTLALGLMFAFGLVFLSGMLLILIAALVILGGGAYVANRLRGLGRLRR
ncbi:hypothetical protein K9U39_02355 [Rhodoblastus acidophilus]|uniref:Uncharacterized protein n=1 Tax=Candidatus Rhodoblastus alkanivorans TaxID=2954117 RepID=A0ABS9Z4C8_9HYPH|nr:hypothetical protein [Candidatus Rhodoblastus alkanivorans]MCI4680570.1 hypothetical protein [Candidatus Rhodoblastus alkanivorans]MCI4682489.1 hypothetical protein [Candidatus Rhodoblastus alkanivorans]MDI4639795.1 hypothetical protein [Rhodoblastus acidophilus]